MVAVAITLPVGSTTATLQPVRKPGSMPMTTRPRSGGWRSRLRRLAEKTWMAWSAGFVGVGGAQLTLQAGKQQPADAIGDGGLDLGAQGRRGGAVQEAGADQGHGVLFGQGQRHLERAVGLAAVDGQRLMGLQLGQGRAAS